APLMLSMCGKRKGGQDNHGNGDVFPLALIGGNPVASAAAYRPVDHVLERIPYHLHSTTFAS
ncbi:hypothetical protein JZ751_004932, partial [Albula glossodonta]